MPIACDVIILYRKQITKALIRQPRCTGWSVPVLFSCSKISFSHYETDMRYVSIAVVCFFFGGGGGGGVGMVQEKKIYFIIDTWTLNNHTR